MPDPPYVAGLERRPAEPSQETGQELSGAGDILRSPPFVAWLVGLIGLGFVVNVMSDRYLYADSFYDLFAGRYILRHGIPRWNVVTVMAHGAPWIDQQWLAHVIYYSAWAVGGAAALAVLSATLVTSGFAVLGLLMLHRGVPPLRMLTWSTAAVVVCVGNTVIRAQSFAFPLLALTLWLILADSGAPRLRARTWLVVPVLVIWANTHGSVLLGAALVALYAAYRAATALLRHERRPVLGYLALGAAAAASVMCTPYGLGTIRFYERIDSVTPALTRYVSEWSPPTLLNPYCFAFFALIVTTAVAVAVAWRRGTRPDPVLAVAALVLLGLALTAIRNQAWFGFGGSLLAADTLARSSSGRRASALSRASGWPTAVIFAAAALVGLGILVTAPDSTFESPVPLRAIDTAADLAARNPAARVLGDDVCSSAMIWLRPAMFGRLGFDARLEQYSAAQIEAYAVFLDAAGRSWPRVMNGYDIVVISRRMHPGLARALVRLPNWRVVYSDHIGLVVERRFPEVTAGRRREWGGGRVLAGPVLSVAETQVAEAPGRPGPRPAGP